MNDHEQWAARAVDLAAFAGRNWVVTQETWVVVLPLGEQTDHRVIAARTGMIKESILQRHFEATAPNGLLGLIAEAPIPSYSAVMRSKWMVFTATATEEPFDTAREFAEHLSHVGLNPIIERYGDAYRILVYFDINSGTAFHSVRDNRPLRLGLELARPFANIEVESVFLLPGMHYKGAEFSAFCADGAWLRGADAVDFLLRGASDPDVLQSIWKTVQSKSAPPIPQLDAMRARIEAIDADATRPLSVSYDEHNALPIVATNDPTKLQPLRKTPRRRTARRDDGRSLLERWVRWGAVSPTWRRWETSGAAPLAIIAVVATWIVVGWLRQYIGFWPALVVGGVVGLPLCAAAVLVLGRVIAGVVDRVRRA